VNLSVMFISLIENNSRIWNTKLLNVPKHFFLYFSMINAGFVDKVSTIFLSCSLISSRPHLPHLQSPQCYVLSHTFLCTYNFTIRECNGLFVVTFFSLWYCIAMHRMEQFFGTKYTTKNCFGFFPSPLFFTSLFTFMILIPHNWCYWCLNYFFCRDFCKKSTRLKGGKKY